jgi:hypothetical protein
MPQSSLFHSLRFCSDSRQVALWSFKWLFPLAQTLSFIFKYFFPYWSHIVKSMATVRHRSTYAPDLFQPTSIPTVDCWQLQLSHFLSEIISQDFIYQRIFYNLSKYVTIGRLFFLRNFPYFSRNKCRKRGSCSRILQWNIRAISLIMFQWLLTLLGRLGLPGLGLIEVILGLFGLLWILGSYEGLKHYKDC